MTPIYEKDIYLFPCGTKKAAIRLIEYGAREFLDLRVYYLGYEEDWLPTKEGFRIEATLESVSGIFDALVDLLSNKEATKLSEKLITAVHNIYNQKGAAGL